MGTGNAGQCYDLALNETAGTRIAVVYDYSGIITGTQTVEAVVVGAATFEGVSATEYRARTTGTNTVTAGGIVATTAIDTTGKYYSRRTGTAEVTNYGALVSASVSVAGISVPTETKTLWSPAWVDRRYGLSVGESLTQIYSGSVTSTTAGLFGAPSTTTTNNASNSQQVKFVGLETITVPAGTYSTCRFEEYATATPGEVSTSWLIVGKGIAVKISTTGSQGTQTVTAKSVKLNGAPL